MRYIFYLILFLFSKIIFGQVGNDIFNDARLHKIELFVTLNNWQDTLQRDYEKNDEDPTIYPEIYRLCDSVRVDGTLLKKCGFRMRGNSSYALNKFKNKQPLKIAFDEFINQKYDGVKKINLNLNTNDPTFLREALVYKLFRNEGIVAPRTSYTQLFINGVYWGLYLIVENVDKTFLADRFGLDSNQGNLYKTNRQAGVTLKYLGSEKQRYKQEGLELKTNETLDDWNRLIAFISKLKDADANWARSQLPQYFNIDEYFKILAIEKLVFSWDSYWSNGNNFYLYEHPNGKIIWIPWDENETFHSFKGLVGKFAKQDYLWPSSSFDKRQLIKVAFLPEENKTKYFDIVCGMLQSGRFGIDSFSVWCAKYISCIDTAYKNDKNAILPYSSFKNALWNTTIENYENKDNGFAINLPKIGGVLKFVNSQDDWALEQMRKHDYHCWVAKKSKKEYRIDIFPNPNSSLQILEISSDQFTDHLALQIELISSHGRVVYFSGGDFVWNKKLKVHLPQLTSGVYVLKVQDLFGNFAYKKLILL